jgi:glyoxylase-like metal-dependent hydrolase (beta-lactamase superfamily II)
MSAYTGNVSVGGSAETRELPGLRITKIAVGPMDNNAYLLACTTTGDQVLIDAAAEPERLLDECSRGQLMRVITTHRHRDHWQGLETVVGVTGARTAAHPLDAPELPIPVLDEVVHGDTITFGDVTLEVIHLRGHTPGSIALLYTDPSGVSHVFTGDSLFPGGVGRTTNPADFNQLYGDVVERLFDQLGDDTWVYPGHGADTTLGVERPHLEEWRARGW